MDKTVTKEVASQVALDYLRKRKCSDRVEVSTVEQKDEDWVIRGTCPIDMEGHPWAEKFEIVIDLKGKVKSWDYSLL